MSIKEVQKRLEKEGRLPVLDPIEDLQITDKEFPKLVRVCQPSPSSTDPPRPSLEPAYSCFPPPALSAARHHSHQIVSSVHPTHASTLSSHHMQKVETLEGRLFANKIYKDPSMMNLYVKYQRIVQLEAEIKGIYLSIIT